MKYKPLNNRTFSKKYSDPDSDPNGMGIFFEGVLDGDDVDPEDSFKDYLKHPALAALHQEQDVKEFTVYGCPVCGDVYLNKDKAEHCADTEKAMVKKFADAKIGSWLKYEVIQEQPLDCWQDLSVGDKFYSQITKFSYCYNGFNCGRILTIHAGGDYINAETMERWSLTTEDEYLAHKRAKVLVEMTKLQKELGAIDG